MKSYDDMDEGDGTAPYGCLSLVSVLVLLFVTVALFAGQLGHPPENEPIAKLSVSPP